MVQTSLGVEEYGFRPTLGEVPSFRLPSTLPNLPMVADISWSGKIASSQLSLFSNIQPTIKQVLRMLQRSRYIILFVPTPIDHVLSLSIVLLSKTRLQIYRGQETQSTFFCVNRFIRR